jgi:uncharacterized BrkB/YihY/UPF0761 family membrane protein
MTAVNQIILGFSVILFIIILCSIASTSIAIQNSKKDNEGNNIYLQVYLGILVFLLAVFAILIYKSGSAAHDLVKITSDDLVPKPKAPTP